MDEIINNFDLVERKIETILINLKENQSEINSYKEQIEFLTNENNSLKESLNTFIENPSFDNSSKISTNENNKNNKVLQNKIDILVGEIDKCLEEVSYLKTNN